VVFPVHRSLKQLAGGVVEIVEVEADERQLRAVMGGGECVGTTDPLPPGPGKTRRFVNVAMEREQRLAVFDEALDRDAADVDIEWCVVDGTPIERSPIEVGSIRR
jgi:hypothetical protein